MIAMVYIGVSSTIGIFHLKSQARVETPKLNICFQSWPIMSKYNIQVVHLGVTDPADSKSGSKLKVCKIVRHTLVNFIYVFSNTYTQDILYDVIQM